MTIKNQVSFRAKTRSVPKIELYKQTTINGTNSEPIKIQNKKQRYFKEKTNGFCCNSYLHFIAVHDPDGSLWKEGNLYLLSKLKRQSSSICPVPQKTIKDIAKGLIEFRSWCLENGVDFLTDHEFELQRPTFKYAIYLHDEMERGNIALSTAKKRATQVVNFYFYLIDSGYKFKHDLFGGATERSVYYLNTEGRSMSKNVTSTAIHKMFSRASETPISQEYIEDGGKLIPLTEDEQKALVNSLKRIGNIEMILIFLLALTTGARMQSVLTMPKSIFDNSKHCVKGFYHVGIGPGTQVDVKNNKPHVIHIPKKLYEMVCVYLESKRYKSRLNRSAYVNEDSNSQYVFITSHRNPYYSRRSDKKIEDLKNVPEGGSIDQFITKKIIPDLRLNNEMFSFRFHDLRATYGVNLVRDEMDRIKKTDSDVSDIRGSYYLDILGRVQERMGHSSRLTTEGYLNWKEIDTFYMDIQNRYESMLEEFKNDYETC